MTESAKKTGIMIVRIKFSLMLLIRRCRRVLIHIYLIADACSSDKECSDREKCVDGRCEDNEAIEWRKCGRTYPLAQKDIDTNILDRM